MTPRFKSVIRKPSRTFLINLFLIGKKHPSLIFENNARGCPSVEMKVIIMIGSEFFSKILDKDKGF